ncbi:MAG: DUF5615 family PIN-like protein [Cyanobacteria bacterium J06638_7]
MPSCLDLSFGRWNDRDATFCTPLICLLELPVGNRSSDSMLSAIADRDGRVVFRKDADFVRSHLLRGTPARLLIVATGTIGNQDLAALPLHVLPQPNRPAG